MTIGFSFLPLAVTKNATVIRILLFFPPLQALPLSPNPLSGKALQNMPVSSMFQISSFSNPSTSSGNRSFHESTVLSLTSPDSPLTVACLMLYLAFHFPNQPFVPFHCNYLGLFSKLWSTWVNVL